jgi:hypothetical protein
MGTKPIPDTPIEEPLAELERRLLAEYFRNTGETYESLHARADPDAHQLLTQASSYVATRLAEVEARSHYLRALRGME